MTIDVAKIRCDEVVELVTELLGDQVRCDANHPLAGQSLAYRVKILAVRPATEDEIAEAASAMDDDEAFDDDDDFDPAAPPPAAESGLVSLRRKS